MGSNTVVVRSFAMVAALHSENSWSVKATALDTQDRFQLPRLNKRARGRLYMKEPVKGVSSPWNHSGRRSGTCVFRAGEAILKARRVTIPLEKKLQTNNRQSLACRTLSACILWGERGGMFCLGVWPAGVQERNLFPAELSSFWLRVILHFKTVLNTTK